MHPDSKTRRSPGQQELFPGFDARQKPLFQGFGAYSTGIWPTYGAPKAPSVPRKRAPAPKLWRSSSPPEPTGGHQLELRSALEGPRVSKCGVPDFDYCEFVGGFEHPLIWEAEHS